MIGLLAASYVKFKDDLISIINKKEDIQAPQSSDFFFEQKEGDPNKLSTSQDQESSALTNLVKPQTQKTLAPEQKVDMDKLNIKPTEKVRSFSQFPGAYSSEQLKDKGAVIKTGKGEIYLVLSPETPLATSNFIFLSNQGFYGGLKFHRVEKDFVIQGGDPNGDGTGGPGYKFQDENVTQNYIRGTVAMANAGPDTNGSQFFIVLKDAPTLPPRYTIFGRVFKGMEVVDKIEVGDVMEKVSIINLVQ